MNIEMEFAENFYYRIQALVTTNYINQLQCMLYGIGIAQIDSRQEQDFSLLHSLQTGCGAHPVSCPMGTGCDFPGVKWPRPETDHSAPSTAEVKNGGAIILLPLDHHGIVHN
jgi:hypothetical protein